MASINKLDSSSKADRIFSTQEKQIFYFSDFSAFSFHASSSVEKNQIPLIMGEKNVPLSMLWQSSVKPEHLETQGPVWKANFSGVFTTSSHM